jgi:hypothetical protein
MSEKDVTVVLTNLAAALPELEAVYKVVVSSSLLKSAMNMNSGTGTSIWRMFHMSSVVD